jgi:hypothetical protein
VAGDDQVPAWPRGEIAGNRRFQIQARPHSSILAGLDSNRKHFFAEDSAGCVVAQTADVLASETPQIRPSGRPPLRRRQEGLNGTEEDLAGHLLVRRGEPTGEGPRGLEGTNGGRSDGATQGAFLSPGGATVQRQRDAAPCGPACSDSDA